MKKIIYFIIIAISLSSCYEDYIEDFDFSSVYFAYQENTRTLVVGEGMEINIGVTLAGVMENNTDRIVNFTIDPSILNGDYTLLPANYYTLSDNQKMVIPKGWHQGSISLKGNKAAIVADPDMLPSNDQKYALPLVITSSNDVDSVLSTKKTAIIALKYEHMLYGNYWHGGSTTIKDAGGAELAKHSYDLVINGPESGIWKMSTISGDKVKLVGKVPDVANNPFEVEVELTYSGEGNSIGVGSAEGATYQIVADGTNSFNNAEKLEERTLDLNFKFEKDGNWYHVSEHLKFRNRIRDGVNEWQGYGARVR